MIEVDWTFLERINLFQVAVFIVALWVIVRLLLRFWPWLRKVMDFTAALSQLTPFIKRTDETLREQSKQLAVVHHELNYNKEGSTKDAVRRIEMGVKGLYERMAAADRADQELRDRMDKTIPAAEMRLIRDQVKPE